MDNSSNDPAIARGTRYWKRRDGEADPKPGSAITFLVLACLAIFVAGIIIVPKQIESSVQNAVIDTLNDLGLGALSVNADGQDIFIAGRLPAHRLSSEISKLQAIARGVTCNVALFGGVVCPAKVFVSIEELPSSPEELINSGVSGSDQNDLTADDLLLKSAQGAHGLADFHNFDIEKDEDFITLNGEMPDPRVRDLMLRRGTKFGLAVIDDMVVSGRATSEYFAWAVERAWAVVQYLESGRVSWREGKFSVDGKITSDRAEFVESAYESEFFEQRLAGINLDVRPVYNDVETCNRAFADVLASTSIEFAPESAKILSSSSSVLDRIAVLAEQCTLSFVVESHTEDSGFSKRDMALSQRRAEAVTEALSKRGIDESRLTARGFGGTKPLQNNNTPLAWMLNRRISIVAK